MKFGVEDNQMEQIGGVVLKCLSEVSHFEQIKRAVYLNVELL